MALELHDHLGQEMWAVPWLQANSPKNCIRGCDTFETWESRMKGIWGICLSKRILKVLYRYQWLISRVGCELLFLWSQDTRRMVLTEVWDAKLQPLNAILWLNPKPHISCQHPCWSSRHSPYNNVYEIAFTKETALIFASLAFLISQSNHPDLRDFKDSGWATMVALPEPWTCDNHPSAWHLLDLDLKDVLRWYRVYPPSFRMQIKKQGV